MEGDERPSDFSILKDSLAELNSLLYSEVSQAVPSIGGSNDDDDDDSSDSGSIDIVFSGQGLPPIAVPSAPIPAPGAVSEPTPAPPGPAPAPSAEGSRSPAADHSQRLIRRDAQDAPEATEDAEEPLDEDAEDAAEIQEPAVQEEKDKGGEGDGWLSGATWTMEGWLSGAAGRLASGKKLPRDEAGAPAASEEQRLRDAAAEAEAEDSFLTLMSRPEEEVVAEAVADSGISGRGMDLESAVSGIDLDGLLQRLRQDGTGAPAAGDHAGVTLQWDLPPADSLFSHEDEDEDEKRKPDEPGGQPKKEAEPQPRQQQAKTPPRSRRRRGAAQQAPAPAPPADLEALLPPPSRPGLATVVLDLRTAQGGNDDSGDSDSDGGAVAAPAEASESSSSDSEEDLEEFYASRRHRDEPPPRRDGGGERAPEPAPPTQRGGSPWGRRGRGRDRAGRAGGRPSAGGSGTADPKQPESTKRREQRITVEQQLAQLEEEHEREEREQEAARKQQEEERLRAAEQRLRAEEAQRQKQRQKQAEERRAAEALQRRQEEEEAAQRAEQRRAEEERKKSKLEADQRAQEQRRKAERKAAAEAEERAAAKKAADFQLAMQRKERERKEAWLTAVAGRCPDGSAPLTHADVTFSAPVSWLPVGEALSDFAFMLALKPAEDSAALPAVADWIIQRALRKGDSEHPFSVVTMGLLPKLPASVTWASPSGEAGAQGEEGDAGPPYLVAACRATSFSSIVAGGMGGFLVGLVRSLKAEAESPGSLVAGHLAAGDANILMAQGFLGTTELSFYPSSPLPLGAGLAHESWWDSATVAVIQQDVLGAPGRAAAALQAAARHGLHVAGMRIVYLSSDQAKELSHRSRHHPPPAKPLLVLLLRGTDAVSRWTRAMGPSDPQLAAAVDPGSLQAALAATAEGLGSKQHQAPLVTGSRDPASVRFEAALFFGGRLFPCPLEAPKPDWTLEPALDLVFPAPVRRLWVLAPAASDQEMESNLKMMEELGRRGVTVQHLRRAIVEHDLLGKACVAKSAWTLVEGAEWWRDRPGDSSALFVACVAAEGAAIWGKAAVRGAMESSGRLLEGVVVVCEPPPPPPTSGPFRLLQQLCDSYPRPSGPNNPPPTGAAANRDAHCKDTQQLVIAAFSAQSPELLFGKLLDLLRQYGAADTEGGADSDPEDASGLPPLPPLQLLAIRRAAGVKEPLRSCFWTEEGAAGKVASSRMQHPVILVVLRGMGAEAFLKGSMAAGTSPVTRTGQQNVHGLLGICADSVGVVLSAFFDDSDFAAEQIMAAPSLELGRKGPLEALLMPAPEENSVVAVDVTAEKSRGILERILKLAAKHGFVISELGTVEVGRGDSIAMLPEASSWSWTQPASAGPDDKPTTAVAIVFRRLGAVQGFLRLLARSGLLTQDKTSNGHAGSCRVAEVLGQGGCTSTSFVLGRGVAAQAGGPAPESLLASLRQGRGHAAAAAASIAQGTGKGPEPLPRTGLYQTSCLVLLPKASQNQTLAPGDSVAALDPASLAEVLRTVHDQGFKVEAACLEDFSPAIAAVHQGSQDAACIAATSALPGKKQIVVLGLSRDNAVGKLQMVVASQLQPGFGGYGALVSQSTKAADQQLDLYFGR